MRLGIAFQVALAIGALNSSNGFVNTSPQLTVRNSCRLRMIGQGWDNEDFLGSLSGGSDAMDAANQKYQAQTEQRGKLQEWRAKQQTRSSSELEASSSDDSSSSEEEASTEEEGQGGSRFKEMLEKSQQAEVKSSSDGTSGPITYNPLEGLETPAAPAAEKAPDAASEADLSMEEQAQLFQKFMKLQQGGGGGEAPAAQKETNPGGKKVGRNRDADTIANTADLYLAQLKRDSTVRTIARYQGDEDKANAVFEDEGVKELEGMLNVNPYLKEGGADRSFLETSTDEMIAVMKLTADDGPGQEKSVKGPSYKEKLAQKRGKKLGSAATPPEAQTTTETQPPPGAQPNREPAPPAGVQPDRMAAQAAPTQPVQQTPPVVSQPEPTGTTVSPPQAASASPYDESEEKPEVRRGLRTLMGLILKHRGGPGFGKGRLKGAEAEGLENLLGEITELLRSEASSGGVAAAEVNVAPAQTTAPPPTVQQPQVVTPPQTAAVPPPPQQTMSSPPPQQQFSSPAVSSAMTFTAPGPPDQRMTSTIACVDGAVMMYKNSPPEIQEGILIPLRGALMTAVNTCNQIIVEKQLDSSLASNAMATSPGSVNERMASMIACVEGAVQMYKNSPPAVQESLLVPLLGALMSAVNTCNQVIAEKELDNVQSYQDAVTESPAAPVESTTTPATPGQFFEVAPYTPGGGTQSGEEATLSMATDETTTMASEPEFASPDADVSSFSGTDENSVFLQTVYDSLEASSGDEKFGLGRLSSSEATDLANKVVDMKGMLIEELDTGIPSTTAKKNDSASGGGSSKYQEMLAKAKAEKNAM